MINRNTPNNELLSNLNGLRIDYDLMKIHISTQIKKYLQDNFKDESRDCFDKFYVDIIDFRFDKLFDCFIIGLKSKKLLSKEDIDNFCNEFDLKLDKVKIETYVFDYSSSGFTKYIYGENDKSFIKYLFKRKNQ